MVMHASLSSGIASAAGRLDADVVLCCVISCFRLLRPQAGVVVCKIVTRGLISKTPEEVAALQIRPRI